jgi:hypothetical protein
LGDVAISISSGLSGEAAGRYGVCGTARKMVTGLSLVFLLENIFLLLTVVVEEAMEWFDMANDTTACYTLEVTY